MQLIRSADGAHEWSASYDRDVDDTIKVQEEIAASLSRALEVTVEAGSLSSSGAKSPIAYDPGSRQISRVAQVRYRTDDGFRICYT